MLSEPFFQRALLAGIGIALVAGPVGSFIVWRRMAYFGESLAHAALLGVALGLFFGVDVKLGVIASGLVMAGLLVALRTQRMFATDTVIGILSHGALALGLITASFMTWVRIDLLGLLFGDILTVTTADLLWVWVGGAAALALMAWLWRGLLAITVHEELARAEGVPARLVEAGFMVLIAFIIATAMKIAGILLITALLIIPAAAARRLATSPEAMAAMAAAVGVIAVVAGLAFSATFDTPSGPSIVVMACAVFTLVLAATGVSAGHLRRAWVERK
jgi:zinc transport system permease protein